MDRIEGVDGLSAAQAQPWRLWAIGRSLGRLHHQLNAVTAPTGLPRVTNQVRHALDSPRIPDAARERVRILSESMPEGDSLCHFDFHPGNVIESPEGPVIIDLASACIGEATADYVRTLMLFAVGTPGGELSLKERALIRFGRDSMRAAYRSGYKSSGSLDEDLARRWMPVIVALRLAEDLPEERLALLRLLSRSLRDAAPYLR
jgi:Ser/Thr protein kinase RdoA (MazF antagonist)